MNLSLWTWMCRGNDVQFVPRIMHIMRALFCLWRLCLKDMYMIDLYNSTDQSYTYPSGILRWQSGNHTIAQYTGEAIQRKMSVNILRKYIALILLYLLKYRHANTKHNKTVLIFYGIYLMIEVLGQDFVMNHNMTLWFLAGNGISFSMAACLITLHRS